MSCNDVVADHPNISFAFWHYLKDYRPLSDENKMGQFNQNFSCFFITTCFLHLAPTIKIFIPASENAISAKVLTDVEWPVAKTKSSALSCCKIRQAPSIKSRACPQSLVCIKVTKIQTILFSSAIRATALVIFLVTKVSPRLGLSWLNMMPFCKKDIISFTIINRHPVNKAWLHHYGLRG